VFQNAGKSDGKSDGKRSLAVFFRIGARAAHGVCLLV
jgi:hypothetical protein